MRRGFDGDGNAGVGAGGGVVAVSRGCEYMGGTHGSGFVFTADDVLEISVVHGRRGVDGMREMCTCSTQGGLGGVGVEWMRVWALLILL